MIWVSNKSSVVVEVSISRTTGGAVADTRTIAPFITESNQINAWVRTNGGLRATIKVGGRPTTTVTGVGPNYHIDVFDDEISLFQPAKVVRL